ncbi:glycosyltransferase family 2 protein [Parasulfuritortus cantonensis]|uniref:Glycosyltransferase family 2 protein n=1 Tax=Parasulfuritortus cantonensis TaxID=2528202 RepID=A0A4V2NVC3_9PROT|nr:glycosyltransferase family A protein [Parasulfuritortus cantonensis]TCJ12806.1 glycosyltransferase family 2 protein [Parasulfuritortus cantonensis]
MRILVVIPVYNRPELVVLTLDAVAAQDRLPDAVAVVDDGSTDDTPERVEAWMAANPALPARLIRTANQGASAARNAGLAELGAGMDAVAFLDSDDLWPADFLARTEAALAAHPDAVAASTDRERYRPHDDWRKHDCLAGLPANPWQWLLLHGAGIGSCTLFRTAAVTAAGNYPVDIPTGHDLVLFGRIARLGPWLHQPGAPVVFRRPRRRLASHDGSHLYQRHPDYLIWWAEAAQLTWREAPAGVHIGLSGRAALARRWHAAAENARHLGRHETARRCAVQALRKRPWQARTWWLLLRSWGGRAAR